MTSFFASFLPVVSIFILRILIPLALTIGLTLLLKRIEASWREI